MVLFYLFSSGLIGLFFLYFSYSLFNADWNLLGLICAVISLICCAFFIGIIFAEREANKTQTPDYITVNIDSFIADYSTVLDSNFLKKLERAKIEGEVDYKINKLVYDNIITKYLEKYF